MNNYEVILVDNAFQRIKVIGNVKKNLSIRSNLIENKENLGYCEGNNIGIRKAKGEFIVI